MGPSTWGRPTAHIRKKVLQFIYFWDNFVIPDVRDDPLTAIKQYCASGSMLEELIHCLPHVGPIFHDENKNDLEGCFWEICRVNNQILPET